MDGYCIESCLKGCSVTRPYFKGIYAVDQIPTYELAGPGFFIINTDISTGPGIHWIVLFFTSAVQVEIFDSLAYAPYTYHPDLRKYLQLGTKDVIYTNKRLQSVDTTVCGPHCLFYCYKKCQQKYSMTTLVNRYYLDDVEYNDCNVLCFVKRKFKVRKDFMKKMVASVPNCSIDQC
jgi:hypothetical protein